MGARLVPGFASLNPGYAGSVPGGSWRANRSALPVGALGKALGNALGKKSYLTAQPEGTYKTYLISSGGAMMRGSLFLFLVVATASIGFWPQPGRAQSGYQVINGTQVYTEIDQAARVATFSNQCGSQTLTQSQLQQGAIPTDIIPCPRPEPEPEIAPPPPPPPVVNNSGASSPMPEPSRSPASTNPTPAKPKMKVNYAQCAQFEKNANTCLTRLKTAASGQGASFQQCIDLYCGQMVKGGCNPSSACTYGTVADQPPVKCGVGQHLFFPAPFGSPPICQDNANGGPKGGPGPSQSDVTGLPNSK